MTPLEQLFERRPLRFAVHVDGRPFGSLYNTSMIAEIMAEEVQAEAPWAAVEVLPTYVTTAH